MPAKSFLVKVELAIQKISCPGVWLCSNGKVSLQLCMLDSTIQTDSYKPLFPITLNEKFIFYKTFLKEKRLNELQRSLGREWLCAELIQWKNCDEGVVLASFQTTLDDLLYPSTRTSNIVGSDVDLLMEPTKLFPGTISPKLELRTKTTIEETFCDFKQICSDMILHRSPVKPSNFAQNQPRKLHPKRVCHTVAYSKAQQRFPGTKKDKRPIFKYKKADDDLILRLNPDKVIKNDVVRVRSDLEIEEDENVDAYKRTSCYCGESAALPTQEHTSSSFVKSVKIPHHKYSKTESQKKCPCMCGVRHEPFYCPVCSKYECTFSVSSTKEFLVETTNRGSDLKLCSYCRINYNKPKGRCCFEKDDVESLSEKKVCFCLPEEKTSSLAQRLHERLRNTVQNGAASIENCVANCVVCE